MYGAPDAVLGSIEWIEKAQKLLHDRNHTTYRGLHMTWSTLFAETSQMLESWHHAGYLSVEMETATWILVVPAACLVLLVFCFNFLGDGLRDALDPRDH